MFSSTHNLNRKWSYAIYFYAQELRNQLYQNHLEGIEMSTQWLYNIFYIRLGGNRIKFCRRILVIPIWKQV